MASRQRLFRVFYRLGFTPWDGHPLAQGLLQLIEGEDPLPPGKALDVGCGTGDNSIYLAQQGWQVTGVDFVATAVDKARAKAAKRGVDVRFLQADATRLSTAAVDHDYTLIVDSGCLHGMSADDRDAYVREITAVAAPDAVLSIVAFVPGTSFGVPGIAEAEVKHLFSEHWSLVSSGSEPAMDRHGKDPARHYVFARRS